MLPSQAGCLYVLLLAQIQVNLVSAHSLGGTAGLWEGQSYSSLKPGSPLSPYAVPGHCWDPELLRPPQCRHVPSEVWVRPLEVASLVKKLKRETQTICSFSFADPAF